MVCVGGEFDVEVTFFTAVKALMQEVRTFAAVLLDFLIQRSNFK